MRRTVFLTLVEFCTLLYNNNRTLYLTETALE